MAWTKEQQMACMGCTEDDFADGIEWHKIGAKSDKDALINFAMSILSDAQEVVRLENGVERNRQFINRAKYLRLCG